MQNLLKQFSSESLKTSLSRVRQRFPFAIPLIFVISFFLSLAPYGNSYDVIYWRLSIIGILTFLLTIGGYLALETRKTTRFNRLFIFIPIFYGIYYYFITDTLVNIDTKSIAHFLLYLIGFISFIFFAPYISRINTEEGGGFKYTNYFSRIAWIFLMSLITGGVLTLLGLIAIGSIITLFGLSLSGLFWILYWNWAVIAFSIIAPIYALMQLPEQDAINGKKYDTNRFFAFLIRYLCIPALFVYFAILYSYSVKVLINFTDWPQGVITWLIIGFSSFWYLIYIFSKPYEDSKFVGMFRKYFPYAVVPQVVMLGYAIYLRIAQYELTMNRYFVVIFGFWLIFISLYLIVSRRKSPIVIPLSLSLISLIISVGPWSVFNYPQVRQEARLMRNLTVAGILQNGKIIPLSSKDTISKELSAQINNGVRSLCSFDECKRIKQIFPDQNRIAEQEVLTKWQSEINWRFTEFKWASPEQLQDIIIKELKVQRYESYESNYGYSEDRVKIELAEPVYYTYSVDTTIQSPFDLQYPIEVKKYDQIVQVMGEGEMSYSPPAFPPVYPYIVINGSTMIARLVVAKGESRIYNLVLPKDILNSATPSKLPKEKLIFTLSDDRYEIQLHLQSLTIKNPKYAPPADFPAADSIYVWSAKGVALIKEKK